jgi:alpha-glucuronidase
MARKRLELWAVRILVTFLLLSLIRTIAAAEDGHAAWLRYAPLEAAARARAASLVPDRIVIRGDSPQILRARDELIRGIRGMVGREVRAGQSPGGPRTMVIGTAAQLAQGGSRFSISGALDRDGYAIETVRDGAVGGTVIAGESDRAVLYGVFAYLRRIALGQLSADLRERSAPAAPVRWLNHWDNLDGTIERGYGGRSIFWEGGRIRDDLSLVDDYGRLLASLGINGLAINSVNANPLVLTLEFLPQIK